MKIKRYMAASMRVALDQVRAEQGPDAVILSSRRVQDGIEVIAAVDYDEALIAGAARQYSLSLASAAAAEFTAQRPQAPVPAAARPTRPRRRRRRSRSPSGRGADAERAPRPLPRRRRSPRARRRRRAYAAPIRAARPPPALRMPQLATPPAAEETRRGFASMQREIKDLRRLLESELAHISWHDKRLREPLQARVLEDLSAMDIAPDVAAALAALTPTRTNLGDPSNIPHGAAPQASARGRQAEHGESAECSPWWDRRAPARPRPSPSSRRAGPCGTAARILLW